MEEINGHIAIIVFAFFCNLKLKLFRSILKVQIRKGIKEALTWISLTVDIP